MVGESLKECEKIAEKVRVERAYLHKYPELSGQEYETHFAFACGHDVHIAILLHATEVLKEHIGDMRGEILIVLSVFITISTVSV